MIDLEPDLLSHLMAVSRAVGKALDAAWSPPKVGMMLAGLEVPHCHVHVLPIEGERDLDFARADPNAPAAELDAAAERIRAALREHGHAETVDA